ncbi:MAG: TonB-dependent receptor [Candidatus Amulumruptor caecigallinarius]|nr:TonB-dependent receptor [Candidatus Amulumruptor caecigallinarius]
MIRYYFLAAAAITLSAAAVRGETPSSRAGSMSSEQAPADSVPTYEELEELVITAKKELVKSDGSKLTYDLEQDAGSRGQSVLDALRKVPMVTVDGRDNIMVKGNSNFRIYVNGKEEPMLTANAKTILKSMPAESVSKIEVITDPGAKYDSEGTGGIINLITGSIQVRDGYAGSLSASVGAQSNSASAYARAKFNRITMDAGLNYSDNYLQNQHSGMNSETINHASDDAYRQTTEMNQDVKFNYTGANINLSWDLSDKDLLAFGGNFYNVAGKIDSIDAYNSLYSRGGSLQWTTRQLATGTMQNLGAEGNTSYKHSFDDKGHNIIAGYRFNYGKTDLKLDYANENIAGTAQLPPYQLTSSNSDTREHTATLDYTSPFAEGKHTLEAGVKGIFRHNTDNTISGVGNRSDDVTDIENGLTRQIQDVYAIYAAYTGNFSKLVANAGVRYEHTHMGLDFLSGTDNDFRTNINDVTPNASLTYMFGPATNLRLSYQMRISRPSLEQMNPSVIHISQTSARVGNPDLESEKYNSLSITYSNFGRVFGGNIGMTLFQSNNTIESYSYYEGVTEYQTYANMGKNRSVSFDGFFNWNISQKMSFSVNGNLKFTDIKSGFMGLKNNGWKWHYGANCSYTGPLNIKYGLYGGQSNGFISLQGDNGGWYYYGLSLSKSFLKEDALQLTVNTQNFLTKYMVMHWNTSTPTHTARNTFHQRSWNVTLSVSWKFGSLKENVKKTGAGLQNDDLKSGSQKGGIGI